MKVYRDLIIRGSREVLSEFVARVTEHLSGGWSRQYDREAEVNKAAFGRMYCFACTAKGTRPASELWLATNSDGSLYVSNILADEHSSLTYETYNGILADFYRICVEPDAITSGVDIELSKPDPQLEDFVSERTAGLLRAFSKLANRSILHPLDQKRWNEFLVSAHREEAALDGATLKRWLIEEESWPEDQALNLAAQYEQARNLLETYESRPA